MALTPSAMALNQYIVVRVTPDQKSYTAFVVDSAEELQFDATGLPLEPIQANANRTTSASTMGTNIQNALPTLGT